MKPFRVQVIADSSGTWTGNGLTFETVAEAETYAQGLFMRWTAVRFWRVINEQQVVFASNKRETA